MVVGDREKKKEQKAVNCGKGLQHRRDKKRKIAALEWDGERREGKEGRGSVKNTSSHETAKKIVCGGAALKGSGK